MRPLGQASSAILAASWDWDDPQTASAAATAGAVLIAIVAATFAYRQVREARRLRVDQAEPYVAASIEPSAASSRYMVDLVIKNYGTTAAFNVKLESSIPLMQAFGAQGPEEIKIPPVIRTLVPGQEWRTLFDSGIERVKSDLPDTYEVVVSYESRGAPKFFKRSQRKVTKHSHTYTLDFASLKDVEFVSEKTIHNVANTLSEVSKTLKSWSDSGPSGLRANIRNGDALDAKRRREFEQQREAYEAHKAHLAEQAKLAPAADSESIENYSDSASTASEGPTGS